MMCQVVENAWIRNMMSITPGANVSAFNYAATDPQSKFLFNIGDAATCEEICESYGDACDVWSIGALDFMRKSRPTGICQIMKNVKKVAGRRLISSTFGSAKKGYYSSPESRCVIGYEACKECFGCCRKADALDEELLTDITVQPPVGKKFAALSGCSLLKNINGASVCLSMCNIEPSCTTAVVESIYWPKGTVFKQGCSLYDCEDWTHEIPTLAGANAIDDVDMERTELLGMRRAWRIVHGWPDVPLTTTTSTTTQSSTTTAATTTTDASSTTSTTSTTELTSTTEPESTTTTVNTLNVPRPNCIRTSTDTNGPVISTHWTVATPTACRDLCRKNSQCEQWTHDRDSWACWVKWEGEYTTVGQDHEHANKYTSGIPFCTLAEELEYGTRSLLSDAHFDVVPSNSFPSSHVYMANFGDCHELCEIHPYCQAYTFDQETYLCQLLAFHKDTFGWNPAPRLNRSIVSGLWNGRSNATLVSQVERQDGGCFQYGKGYSGGPNNGFEQARQWVKDIESCYYVCNSQPQCTNWTFRSDDHFCFTYWKKGELSLNDNNLTSGVRGCRPPRQMPATCFGDITPHRREMCQVYIDNFVNALPSFGQEIPYREGYLMTYSNFNTWWRKGQGVNPDGSWRVGVDIDWSDVHSWQRTGYAIAINRADGLEICNVSDWTPPLVSCWAERDLVYPLNVYLSVVARKDGEEWVLFHHITKLGADAYNHHGFSFDPDVPQTWTADKSHMKDAEVTIEAAFLSDEEVEVIQGTMQAGKPILPLINKAGVRDYPDVRPKNRDFRVLILFCVWAEYLPDEPLFITESSKHTEICALPLYLM